jgi:hypothetical protein
MQIRMIGEEAGIVGGTLRIAAMNGGVNHCTGPDFLYVDFGLFVAAIRTLHGTETLAFSNSLRSLKI